MIRDLDVEITKDFAERVSIDFAHPASAPRRKEVGRDGSGRDPRELDPRRRRHLDGLFRTSLAADFAADACRADQVETQDTTRRAFPFSLEDETATWTDTNAEITAHATMGSVLVTHELRKERRACG
jgi:hypothetical protein